MWRSPAFRFRPAVPDRPGDPLPRPTRAQELGWPELQADRSTLIFAPTGSGKTLAAFLAAIDRLMFAPVPAEDARTRIVYVSPLRALAVDVERNLRAPLAGSARIAGEGAHAHAAPSAGHPDHHPGVAVPAAHVALPRDPRVGPDGDRGRDPPARSHQARRAP